MASYTFTPSSAYALNTHEVTFTKDRLKIKLISSGQFVYDEDYSNGIDFRCDGNIFQIGTLNASQVFVKQVSIGFRKAGLWIQQQSNNNKFIGTNDLSDTSIYNIYNINQCPVRLAKNGSLAEIKCPCDGDPCTNGCYQYGQ